MDGDHQPASTTAPASPDPVLTSGSLAAFAATTIDIPRAASTTLDVARHHAFTGEITFMVEPQVRVYLDGGVVYHAERDGEPTISQALVAGEVVTAEQLRQGMVRVGDVEHLGRLFERDQTIDRDAVMVVIEHHTDIVVAELARGATTSVTINPYRHHPTGVHRWFAAPADLLGQNARPVSDVAQIDRSVVEEIPDLGRAVDGIRIEWDEPDPADPSLPLEIPLDLVGSSEFDVQEELDRFDADNADWAMEPSAAFGATRENAWDSPLGEFHIVWPDGTAEDALARADWTAPAPTSRAPLPDEPEPLAPVAPLGLPVQGSNGAQPVADPPLRDESTSVAPLPAWEGLSHAPPTFPASPAEPDEDVRVDVQPDEPAPEPFATPEPAIVAELPPPDAVVPDDVAAAVRRALRAIEEASTRREVIAGASGTRVGLPRLEMPSFRTPVAPVVDPLPTPVVEAAAATAIPTAAPTGAEASPPPDGSAVPGFAPPTPDMRAEAIYAREEMTDVAAGDDTFAMVPEAGQREVGKASVVFIDEEPIDTTERRGALRRLIKGLRRGD